ncbi:MAG: putative ABC transporter permease subunit [Chloroflexia bacterium]
MCDSCGRTLRTVLLLLEAQWLLFRNHLRRSEPRRRLAWVLGGIGLGAAGTFFAVWGYALGRLLRTATGVDLALFVEAGLAPDLLSPERLLAPLVFLVVTGVWGLILLSGLGTAIRTFYLSSDLELLMAAPIPSRAIFAAKFLESLGIAYLLLFTLALPALVGLGAGARFAGAYYFGCLLLFLLLPLVPQAVAMLLVLPLVRLIPPRRLREALSLLGAAVGTAFYLFTQMPQTEWLEPRAVAQALGILRRAYLPFLPQAWAAEGLRSLAEAAYGRAALHFGALALLSMAVCAGCVLLAENLYYAGWASLQTASGVRRGVRRRRTRSFRDVRILPRPMIGIVEKDIRALLRNPNHWSQMLMPLAGFAVVIVQSLRSRLADGTAVQLLNALSPIGFILLLALAAVARLGLAGIGGESQQLWLLRIAPVSTAQLLWAKWTSAYLPYAVLASLMLMFHAVLTRLDGQTALAAWLFLMLAGAGGNAIGVGLGASSIRLERERATRPISTGAGCLYYPLTGSFAAFLSLGIAIALGGEILLEMGWPSWAWVARVCGFLMAVVLATTGLVLPLRIGARRLAQIE